MALWCILLLISGGCGEQKKEITSLDDLKNVKIGAMTGSTGEALSLKRFPAATTKSFDDIMDAIAAIKSNQIDAVITSYPTALNICKHNQNLCLIHEPVDYEDTAIAVKKNEKELLASLNQIINELANDGTLDDLKKRWLKTDMSPYEEKEFDLPKEGNVLTVGTAATREPICFINGKNEVSGFDGELARIISIKLGRPIVFKDMTFSALIPALMSGKVDAIITGMTATDERRKSVDFTTPYYKNSQVMIVRKPKGADKASVNTPDESAKSGTKAITSLDDLKHAKIGAMTGSTGERLSLARFPTASTKSFDVIMDAVAAMNANQLDAVIISDPTALNICKHNQNLCLIPESLDKENIAIAVRKNEKDLLASLNNLIKDLKNDGTLDDLKKRWFKTDTSPYEEKEFVLPKEGSVLTIGTSATSEPFCFINGKNEVSGLDGELARIISMKLGRPIVFKDMTFSALIPALLSGKVDIIISGMTATEERSKSVDFTASYYQESQVVIVKKPSGAEMASGNVPVDEAKPDTDMLRTMDDLAEKDVGVYEGTVHDSFVAKKYPKAGIKRYNSSADMVMALKTKKISAALLDALAASVLIKTNSELGILDNDVLTLPLGMGFNKKDKDLLNRFNNYLKTAKSDGSFDVIYNRWYKGDPEKAQMPKFKRVSAEKKLVVGVAVEDLPYVAYMNGEYVGIDIEIVQNLAQNEGFDLEIVTMEFPALVTALISGKVDMITDGIAITEERQKQIDFSDSYADFNTAAIALKKNIAAISQEPVDESLKISFFQSVIDGFNNNLIKEKRYLLIVNGLTTTVIISIFATILGTFLGALVCFMRMSRNKLVNSIAAIYISVLRGTPVLVLLMITFYVVFASVNIDPVFVAVIAFGLNFAAYVSEMFRAGIEGVDSGQTEAGIAIGFSKIKTFIYIVMPQATRRILPIYKGEFISLIKMTSIVGYIAVQDLTKASDIIRSRTFDAFFPLIMVAVLYYLISWVLMLALGYVERMTDPKLRTRKGR
jgi:polar amino acid transport system substrate-binding protein